MDPKDPVTRKTMKKTGCGGFHTDLCLLLYAAVEWSDEEDQTMLQMIIIK